MKEMGERECWDGMVNSDGVGDRVGDKVGDGVGDNVGDGVGDEVERATTEMIWAKSREKRGNKQHRFERSEVQVRGAIRELGRKSSFLKKENGR